MQLRSGKSLVGWMVVVLLALAVGLPLMERLVEAPVSAVTAEARLQSAFDHHRDGFWIQASARVVKALPDDRKGSRHQRVIVELDSGQTLLVAHNIDLAPRLESISSGDTLRFRGKYAWNAQGGVIHWTHHDPSGERAGGWLEFEGRRYR